MNDNLVFFMLMYDLDLWFCRLPIQKNIGLEKVGKIYSKVM